MNKKVYLSKEGIEKLEYELRGLTTIRRLKIAEKIRIAKEQGDLSENAEYSTAKDEQAFNERRIVEITDMLKNAELIDLIPAKKGTVGLGSRIIVASGGESYEYVIVGSSEANPELGKISNESPIGKAFIGKKVGEKIDVTVPAGTIAYTITSVV